MLFYSMYKSPRDFSCAIFEWAAITMHQNVHFMGRGLGNKAKNGLWPFVKSLKR